MNISFIPHKYWLTWEQRREPKQAEPTPSPSTRTLDRKMQLSAEKAVVSCLGHEWFQFYTNLQWDQNENTAQGERNTIYIQEWHSLSPYLQEKKNTDRIYFPHASIKPHFVPTFLTTAFCLSFFLMFSNLFVKIAPFSQSHMPILPKDKTPCQNSRQRF